MEQKEKPDNKIVQTYADDMAEVIGGGTEGLVKKIIHGEEMHEEEKSNLSPESKKNKRFMLIGGILILLSLITLSLFFFVKGTINTVPAEKQFTPLIYNDQIKKIEVAGFNKDEIAQTVLNEVNASEVKKDGLEGIYLTENKQLIGLRRFLELIKANLVVGKDTFLIKDEFLTGVVNGETKDFFILIKVRSIGDIFDTMRAWEFKMFPNLHTFFGVSLSKETNYLFTKDFEDGIVANKNARILRDRDGKIVVMYIYADDNSVIITNTESAAHEVMLRLSGSQKKQ